MSKGFAGWSAKDWLKVEGPLREEAGEDAAQAVSLVKELLANLDTRILTRLCGDSKERLETLAGSAVGWILECSEYLGKPGFLEKFGEVVEKQLAEMGWVPQSGKPLEATGIDERVDTIKVVRQRRVSTGGIRRGRIIGETPLSPGQRDPASERGHEESEWHGAATEYESGFGAALALFRGRMALIGKSCLSSLDELPEVGGTQNRRAEIDKKKMAVEAAPAGATELSAALDRFRRRLSLLGG